MVIKCNLTLSNNKKKSLSLLTIMAEENWNLELCDSDFKKNSKTATTKKAYFTDSLRKYRTIQIFKFQIL